jgi:vacuolar-type H+-ATPase subunit I/STV1
LIGFDFFKKYRVAFGLSLFLIIFASSFALAQTSLPNSPLYSLKLLTQNIRIVLAPSWKKPLLKMEISEIRLNDLAKVKDLENKKNVIAEEIQKDLETVPSDLKKLPVRKNTLVLSQKIQQKGSDLSKTLEKLNLENSTKNSLSKTLIETQNQVLALINETEEKISNCPVYLNEKLDNLQKTIINNPQMFYTWSGKDLVQMKADLADAYNDLKAGNCLEAMDKIESINQILQIHSLDTTTSLGK